MIGETSRRNVLRAGLGLLAGILVPLKAFAQQTLPTIKEHLTQAQSMVQQAQAQ